MNGNWWRVLAGAAVTVMLAAQAATANDAQTCENESGDVAIAACTRAIAAGNYRGHGLAITYHNRGLEYQGKGDPDRAFADYDEAIRIDPRYAEAYSDRGNVWNRKGDLDRAIADYTEAIQLNPRYAIA